MRYISGLCFFCFCLATVGFCADEKFTIRSEDFRLGEEIRLDALTAIGKPGDKIRSEAPQMANDQLYMRRKIDGRIYGWFGGKLNPEPFRKLYAFDLQAAKISNQEALHLRFYTARRAKPYRDIAEVYFDGVYLYSSQVPILYFVKNDEWQSLESVIAPGVVSVVSNAPSLFVKRNGQTHIIPHEFFPEKKGLFYAEISGENFFPYIGAVNVSANKITTLRAAPMPSVVPPISFRTTVTPATIADADSLEKVERLYDTFRKDSLMASKTISDDWFGVMYPKKILLEDTSSAEYRLYSKAYDSLKAYVKTDWLKARLDSADLLSQALFSRMKDFEKDTVFVVSLNKIKVFKPKKDSLTSPPKDSLATKVQSADSSVADSMLAINKPEPLVKIDSVQIGFYSADGRMEAAFRGDLADAELSQELVQGLASGSVKVEIVLEKNKPAWIFAGDSVRERKQYRYKEIYLDDGKTRFRGQGIFILPERVEQLPEVQAWLHPAPVKIEKIDSLAALDSVLKVEKTSEDMLSLFKDEYRGECVLLDSSTFRFRGKVVGISSFAIQTREVSQQDFAKVLAAKKFEKNVKDRSVFKHSEKPVHNITWEDAHYYCNALGGELPTEAQWEYAARAGGNDGLVWESFDSDKPHEYAVYKENSGKLSKKDSAYGPHAVASLKPNRFGIYDMAGNVAEWTVDNYSTFSFWTENVDPTGSWLGYTKIYKGGSFKDKAKNLNATLRDDEDPRYWSEELGFRCVFSPKVVQTMQPKETIRKDSAAKPTLDSALNKQKEQPQSKVTDSTSVQKQIQSAILDSALVSKEQKENMEQKSESQSANSQTVESSANKVIPAEKKESENENQAIKTSDLKK